MTSDRAAAALAIVITLAMAGTAWRWRTAAVGGSDSACYALMAGAFAAGQTQPMSALALTAPWPDPTRVAAPAGFLPSAITPGAAVPVCAPGYSLLVAPLVWIAGPAAIHVVPPLAAAALTWLAYLLGRRLHSAWAGAGAALLVAAHPVVLFQAVQPMNDITTGALWLAAALAAVSGRPLATGLVTGAALLVRPNLVPAGAVVLLTVVWMAARPFTDGAWRRACLAALIAGGATLPGIALALALNAALYGSPLQSGYGDLGTLFAAAHVPVNVAHYGWTWLTTSTPLVLLSLGAPWLVRGERRLEAWALVLTAAGLAVVYLAYRPFPEWWYLRFLLPGVALSLVLAVVAASALAARAGHAGTAIATLAIVGAAAWGVRSPEARDAFGLQQLESRFPLAAGVVADRLPAHAVAITVWQSGGVRFWPGREVVVWDALDPAWLDRGIAWLAEQGRPPAIVVEQWEEEGFRTRFAGQAYGALDWPPRYAVDRRVRIYLPADRAAYLRGEQVPTETVFAPR